MNATGSSWTDAPPDRGFDELVRMGLSLIPAYAPEWTQHNAADPGITLVELLAYLTEILAYRAGRITPDAKLAFLRLLEGGEPPAGDGLRGAPASVVESAILARVQALSRVECAVTPADFETLAVQAARAHLAPDAAVHALCLPGVDLRAAVRDEVLDGGAEAPGDVSVLLAPEQELTRAALAALCEAVRQALAPRCLMTTRAHVVGPVWLHVAVGCRIALRPGARLGPVIDAVDTALRRRFGPAAPGEPPPRPRPFGQSLGLGEIADVIDGCEGVDWVEDIAVMRLRASPGADDAGTRVGVQVGTVATAGEDAWLGGRASRGFQRLVRDAHGELESLRLRPWERVRVRLERTAVRAIGSGDAGGSGR